MRRICEREEETTEHLTGGCEGEKKERGVKEFPGEAGGLEEMKSIIWEKKKEGGGEGRGG